MRRILAAVLAAALVLTTLAVTSPTASAQDGEVTITILHNNDGESKLLGDAEDGEAGIARFVAALKELQSSAPGDGVVTLTSGDNFLASKEFSASLNKGAPFYDSIALSGLYDAMALGNHDFDFGPDVTAEFVAGFDPAIPFLSANADFSGEPALAALVADGRIAASTVIETGGTEVGVIGAITPRLPNISSPRGVVISGNVAAAVNAEVAALEDAGVNKIILVSHLQGLSQDKDLVPQLNGVDVVIAGGGDELLKNDGDTCIEDEEAADEYPLLIGDIPVVTGPGGYRCIGQLNVTFNANGEVTNAEGASIGVAVDGPEDDRHLAGRTRWPALIGSHHDEQRGLTAGRRDSVGCPNPSFGLWCCGCRCWHRKRWRYPQRCRHPRWGHHRSRHIRHRPVWQLRRRRRSSTRGLQEPHGECGVGPA